MSNEIETKRMIRSSGVPGALITQSLSDASAEIYNRIGDGLRLPLEDKNDNSAEIIIESIDASHDDATRPSLAILTALGSLEFHNFEKFLQALSGFPVDQSLVENDELIAVMLGRLPEGFVRPFGWLAPLQNVYTLKKDDVTVSLRLVSKDLSVVTLATATAQLWTELFSHKKIKKLVTKDSKALSIPLDFPCSVGKVSITPALFRTLQPGDVVFLDESSFDVSGRGLLEVFCRRYDIAMARKEQDGSYLFSVLGEREELHQKS